MSLSSNQVIRVDQVRVPSDNLRSLYDLCDRHPVLVEMLGMLPRIRLVIDTNIVLQELLFVTKGRRLDSARSALREVMDCGIVVTIAPMKLYEEVNRHLPRLAEAENVSIEKMRSAWSEFQARIEFRETPEFGSVERDHVIDPDDLPFVTLYLSSNVHAVLTHDKDISRMGAETLDLNDVMHVRDYARAKSPEVTIRVGGVLVVGVAIGGLVALVKLIAAALRGFSKLSPEIQILLIAGAIFAALHPATRKTLLAGVSAIGEKLKGPTVVFGEVFAEMSLQMGIAELTVKEKQIPVDNIIGKRFQTKSLAPVLDIGSAASTVPGYDLSSVSQKRPVRRRRRQPLTTSMTGKEPVTLGADDIGGLVLVSSAIVSSQSVNSQELSNMKKGTSAKISRLAAKVLENPSSGAKARELAGSALTQFKAPKERSSSRLASIASDVLRDGRSSKTSKELAGSVLAQRKK